MGNGPLRTVLLISCESTGTTFFQSCFLKLSKSQTIN
jgi:hypothetical protein